MILDSIYQTISFLPFISKGIIVTLQYTITSLFFGLIIGIIISLFKFSSFFILTTIGNIYVSIFRGTPLLVQLFLVYFGTPQLIGYKIGAFEAGILAFSLNSGAYVSEIIRAGIQSVDKGQFEAAASLGLSYIQTMKDIIFPQAIRNILPALVNEAINLLKESSLVSTIGVWDLMRRARIIGAEKFIYLEPLICVAIIYYLLVMVFTFTAKTLENKLKIND